jgi:hypothetical protein
MTTGLSRVNPPNRSNAKTGHFLEGAHSLEILAMVRTFESAIQVQRSHRFIARLEGARL